MPQDFVRLTMPEHPHLLFSPDGSRIVVGGRSGQKRQLWMGGLDSPALRPVAGAEEGRSAVFSPDSRSLAVVTGANLQRLDLATGAIRPLTELRGFVTSWSREGVILAAEDYVIH